MFGKKKDVDVRLTEKQLEELKKNMSRSERKEFERKQKQAADDKLWDAMILSELFEDD